MWKDAALGCISGLLDQLGAEDAGVGMGMGYVLSRAPYGGYYLRADGTCQNSIEVVKEMKLQCAYE